MELIKAVDLQAQIDDLYQSLGAAVGPVSMVTTTTTPALNPNLASATTTTTTKALVNPVPGVVDVSVQEVIDSRGLLQQGDIAFYVSASAASAAEVAGASRLTYSGKSLEIIRRVPEVTVGGQVLLWRVVAGVRA